MKFVAALMGLAIAGLFAWLLWPTIKGKLDAPSKPPSAADSVTPLPDGLAPPKADRRDPVPFSPTETESKRDKYGKLRIPYFRFLREQLSKQVLKFWVDDDLDTLNLQLPNDGDADMNTVVNTAVTTDAATYGFRRVRFLIANNVGNPEPFHCFAEASRGEDGRWTVFRK